MTPEKMIAARATELFDAYDPSCSCGKERHTSGCELIKTWRTLHELARQEVTNELLMEQKKESK